MKNPAYLADFFLEGFDSLGGSILAASLNAILNADWF
jgi:hypothetical protein